MATSNIATKWKKNAVTNEIAQLMNESNRSTGSISREIKALQSAAEITKDAMEGADISVSKVQEVSDDLKSLVDQFKTLKDEELKIAS